VIPWSLLTEEEQRARFATYPERPDHCIADHFFIIVNDRPVLFGDVMTPWQKEFFEAVFTRNLDGTPKHRVVYSERRRGESKSEDLACIGCVDLLFAPKMSKSYVVAADADQAGIVMQSVERLQATSPILKDLVVTRSVVTNLKTGSTLTILAADERTNWGLRARRILFDELSLQVNERLWTVMISTLGKSNRSQLITCTMAGWDQTSIAYKVRKTALGNPDYYYQSREATELAPWLSAKDMDEQRDWLHPAEFARLWECRWVEAEGRFLTADLFDASITGKEQFTGDRAHRYYIYVDLGWVHDATCVAVVHVDGDRVILDTLRTIQPTPGAGLVLADVDDLVVALTEQFPGVRAVTFEAPQAMASVQSLSKRLPGIPVNALHPSSVSQADLWGNFFMLFQTYRLVTYPHDQLRKEALNLQTKVVGGRITAVGTSAIHQDTCIALGGAALLAVQSMKTKERMDYAPISFTRVSPVYGSEGPQPRLTSDRGWDPQMGTPRDTF